MTLTSLIQTFKDSVAQANLQMELTAEYCVVCLAMALACALIIMLTYRLFYRGACYSANFNILLALTSLVTTTISANIVLSLGMVGALSIVRFRAAVKDPLDVGFLFWSVAVGITCGAGLYLFALLGTLFMALVYIELQLIRGKAHTYLVIARYTEQAAAPVEQALKAAHAHVRSRATANGATELTASVFCLFRKVNLDQKIAAIDGVLSSTVIEYTGDI